MKPDTHPSKDTAASTIPSSGKHGFGSRVIGFVSPPAGKISSMQLIHPNVPTDLLKTLLTGTGKFLEVKKDQIKVALTIKRILLEFHSKTREESII